MLPIHFMLPIHMDEEEERRAARAALDRFEAAFLASAETAGVGIHRLAPGARTVDHLRGVDGVLFTRKVLGDAERILLDRWDRGLLLSAWVLAWRPDRGSDWLYTVHLARNRCHEVVDDPRRCGDGKDVGSLEWILELVVAWIIDLRDLWENPIPRPVD